MLECLKQSCCTHASMRVKTTEMKEGLGEETAAQRGGTEGKRGWKKEEGRCHAVGGDLVGVGGPTKVG